MNKVQILNKIARNLAQRGIVVTQGALALTTPNGVVVSCVDASIQAPMGGVDGSVSPFLGIGVAAPGQIQVRGASGDDTLAAIFTTAQDFQVLREVCGFANDVVIVDGTTGATVLAVLPGMADLQGMGQ